VACDRNAEYMARARRTWREAGVEDKIELRLAPALDPLTRSLPKATRAPSICLHRRRQGELRELTTSGRWCCFAPVADRRGQRAVARQAGRPRDHTVDTEAMRAFNRKLHADDRVALSLVTMGDGLALACKL